MGTISKHKTKDNDEIKLELKNSPIYYSNHKTDAAKNAYETFGVLVEELIAAKGDNLTREDIEAFESILKELEATYAKRKVSIYFEEKLKNATTMIAERILSTLIKPEAMEEVTSYLYYNDKKHIIKHG